MLNEAQKNIIIRALTRRKTSGENVTEILKTYKNLSDEEKHEVLVTVEELTEEAGNEQNNQ